MEDDALPKQESPGLIPIELLIKHRPDLAEYPRLLVENALHQLEFELEPMLSREEQIQRIEDFCKEWSAEVSEKVNSILLANLSKPIDQTNALEESMRPFLEPYQFLEEDFSLEKLKTLTYDEKVAKRWLEEIKKGIPDENISEKEFETRAELMALFVENLPSGLKSAFLDPNQVNIRLIFHILDLYYKRQGIIRLKQKILDLQTSKAELSNEKNTVLKWTGSKVDFIRLVYALFHGKYLNKGEGEIKIVLDELSLAVGYEEKLDANILYSSIHDSKKYGHNQLKIFKNLEKSFEEYNKSLKNTRGSKEKP